MDTPGTFPDPPLEIPIIRSHDINLMLHNPIHQAIAMTHEVMIGVHFAYKQSIMDSRRGNFRCTMCERKFVHQNGIRWDKAGIVLEEEGRGDLRSAGWLD
jgi:hypothetical protein